MLLTSQLCSLEPLISLVVEKLSIGRQLVSFIALVQLGVFWRRCPLQSVCNFNEAVSCDKGMYMEIKRSKFFKVQVNFGS